MHDYKIYLFILEYLGSVLYFLLLNIDETLHLLDSRITIW